MVLGAYYVPGVLYTYGPLTFPAISTDRSSFSYLADEDGERPRNQLLTFLTPCPTTRKGQTLSSIPGVSASKARALCPRPSHFLLGHPDSDALSLLEEVVLIEKL